MPEKTFFKASILVGAAAGIGTPGPETPAGIVPKVPAPVPEAKSFAADAPCNAEPIP